MPVEPNMYDDDELVQMRASQEDPIVMYIIVKKSLKMSAGKTAAQAAHGAQMIILRYHQLLNEKSNIDELAKCANMETWLKKSFRKIVLKASDIEFEKAKKELHCVVVRDAGLTELDPKTETVICTWPIKKSSRPSFLKRLRVL